MKEKFASLLVWIKEHQKVVIPVAIAVLVLLVIMIVMALAGRGPSKYEDKVKEMTKALYSEDKMKSAISKIIDVRAAAAWQEAECKSKNFNKEYKKMKKNADEVDDLKDALKEMATGYGDDDIKFKVSNIKKPKQDSKNKKIYTVSATLEEVYDDSSYNDKMKVKFVFYGNKIIDILDEDDDSLFADALSNY